MEQSLQGSREQEKGVGTSRLTSQTCSFYAGVNTAVEYAPSCELPGRQAAPALM